MEDKLKGMKIMDSTIHNRGWRGGKAAVAKCYNVEM